MSGGADGDPNTQIHPGGQRPYIYFPRQSIVYDGKRKREAVTRKTVDFNASSARYLENRLFYANFREYPQIQPHEAYTKDILPPTAMLSNPENAITGRYVHTSQNKNRCPVNVVTWTPEGRRLLTGCSSGEFTLWIGLTFNFETILQAHDHAVRAMVWSHNDNWMISGDQGGIIKYWQPNMNNVKAFQGHKESIRGITFAPTDTKFASCSDDVTIKIWDFAQTREESELKGHGWDVKCVDWHPYNSLIVSGSKDNLIKLWDAKSATNVATLHGHKNTVTDIEWNRNGNWILSSSRDQLIKVYDVRTMKELQTFRGHKKDVSSISWHPIHESFFVSGGFDGGMCFWLVGNNDPTAEITNAHDNSVWSLAWHPLGHILCSGSNDHTTKFWTRNRPGDPMTDKYSTGGVMGMDIEEDAESNKSDSGKKLYSLQPGLVGVVASSSEAPMIPGLGVLSTPQNFIKFHGVSSSPSPTVPASPVHYGGGGQYNQPHHQQYGTGGGMAAGGYRGPGQLNQNYQQRPPTGHHPPPQGFGGRPPGPPRQQHASPMPLPQLAGSGPPKMPPPPHMMMGGPGGGPPPGVPPPFGAFPPPGAAGGPPGVPAGKMPPPTFHQMPPPFAGGPPLFPRPPN